MVRMGSLQRTAGATSWATNDRIAADNNGHHRTTTAQFTEQTRPSGAGCRALPRIPDTEEVAGSDPVALTASDRTNHVPLVNRPTVARQTARFRGMPKRKAPAADSSDGTLPELGRVSQRASASTRMTLAAAALVDPLGEALPNGRAGLLWRSPAGRLAAARRGSQEVSREQPPQGSSPHAGAETDQRYRLQRWHRGNEKRPACARRSASATYWRLPQHPVNPGIEGHCLDPCLQVVRRWQGCVALVRAGSARHQESLVSGGHERSPSANQHRRSETVHRFDQGRRSSTGLGSNPTSGPKAAQVGDRAGRLRVGLAARSLCWHTA
jgi:hypothetical protein